MEDRPCLGLWRGGPNEEYIWLKYSDVDERATALGAGLANLSIESGQDSYVGICCPNMPEVRSCDDNDWYQDTSMCMCMGDRDVVAKYHKSQNFVSKNFIRSLIL